MNVKNINGSLMKSNEMKVLEKLFSDSCDSVLNQLIAKMMENIKPSFYFNDHFASFDHLLSPTALLD